jgi:hypothetical protein
VVFECSVVVERLFGLFDSGTGQNTGERPLCRLTISSDARSGNFLPDWLQKKGIQPLARDFGHFS